MSKLLVKPTRYFKVCAAFGAMLIAFNPLVSLAQELPAPNAVELDMAFKRILEQNNKDSLKGKLQNEDFGWLHESLKRMAQQPDQLEQVASEIGAQAPRKAGFDINNLASPEYDTLMFVSYSMPESELFEVLSYASEDKNTLVLMRGIPDGQTIEEGIIAIQQIAASFENVPNIALDPTAFDKYDINVVPSIVALDKAQAKKRAQTPIKDVLHDADAAKDLLQRASQPNDPEQDISNDKGAQYLAKVSGISNPLWLKLQIKNGASGDLGTKGPVLAIAEPDLIEVMKKRIGQIDWDEKRETAIKNYWPSRAFIEIEQTTNERVRRIDASVVATADIKTSKGEFVARTGDRVNPLKTRAFTQAIVVFDATSKEQVQTVINSLEQIKAKDGVQQLVFITTRMNRQKGWDGYKEITELLDAPVFVLTSDVKERFVIERVPSVITADDTHFIVHELAIEENNQEAIQVSNAKVHP